MDDGVVEVRLLYFDDCPNWRLAESRLLEAVAELGECAPMVAYERVCTPDGRVQGRGV